MNGLNLITIVVVIASGVWLVWSWRRPSATKSYVAPFLGVALISVALLQSLAFIGLTTPASLDPIAELVARLQPASAAFFVASPVKRDEAVEATLDIAPPSIDPFELQNRLRQLAGRTGVGASSQVSIATRMVASLTGDRDCVINPKLPVDQVLRRDGTMKWAWTVTPKVGGLLTLTLALSAPVDFGGHESSYVITTYKKTVTVIVTAPNQAQDWLTWLRTNWVVLAAVGTALLAAGEWLRRRRKKPGAGYRPD
jgi:hypothetical protein